MKTILHADADAFFASVETALNPTLRGKPVAVINAHLGNRAIVLTASYEARKFGVKTGVLYVEAKRLCPTACFVPVNMHAYGLYSLRIDAILRRSSPSVEAASVDEWFVDLTGLRSAHHASYADIALRAQAAVERELGITISCGIAHTKTLAKMASDFRKPRGLTVVRTREREAFLAACPLADVPGFGPNTQALLQHAGCRTTLDVLRLGEPRIRTLLGKRGAELFRELSGEAVHEVVTVEAQQQSLSHHRTFIEFPVARHALFAEVELLLLEASAKLRKLHLAAREVSLVLREADYTSRAASVRLSGPTANESIFIAAVTSLFPKVFRSGPRYRAAGVGLGGLTANRAAQLSLLDERENKSLDVLPVIDALNAAHGRGTVTRAAALPARPKAKAFVGEREGRRLNLPEMS